MKRNLTLILAGLLTLSVQGQETNTVRSMENLDDKTKRQTAANYYKAAAEGYLEAANNKLDIVRDYQKIIAPIEERIKTNVETNYPAAWIKVATYLKSSGTLEKQVATSLLRAGASLEKAYDARLKLGQKVTSFLETRDSLDYQKHFDLSRIYYSASKEYFEKAGDKLNATAVTELIAIEDEQTGDAYNSLVR
jgi:hypothetical protein